ncbi:DUF913-domain-containing protein [Violaceomyces palustris]|uniref:DUF913-domain-containing protein n=1 Tax=Violaceomyces palustris TaxID=1673888 RepID=A0ACD0NT19_9BASI|nr:DUF913-domain-containing protein [Violaceomyces palustris]
MKITKTPKRLAPAAPEVLSLLNRVSTATDDELPDILDSISEWCWPRGDLYYWTQVLNRFDSILEETCRDYELSKLQINDFTPLRKRLVVSILRFSRLLIENCTNRKLYASYEHLNALLFTPDLDVLEATLRLLLRPAQQHSSQSGSRHHHELHHSKDRLATLAMCWPPREHGLSLVDFAKDGTAIPPELLTVKFQFYKRHTSVDAAGGAGNASYQGAVEDDATQVALSTPTRPRARDGRPAAVASSSASAGLSTPHPQNQPQDRGEGPSTLAKREGLTTVDLGRVTEQGKTAMDLLADAVEAHGIPPGEHFELFQKIRLAMCLPDPDSRRQLLICRLLAIACYCHIVPESIASTQMFLYEPDLVHRVAALLEPSKQMDALVQSGALYALDGLGRYRAKLNEVLSSVNVSVNHGILLSVLRNLVDDLSTDQPKQGDHFVDSLLGFVAFVTSTGAGSGMIVGAGLVPILVDLVKVQNPNTYMVQRTVSRAIGLIDSVIYAYPPAFQLFCGAQGLVVLVDRIEQEVDRDIEDASEQSMDDSVFNQPGPDNLYGKLAFGRASLLRNMFKSISHMMSSTGTADGLRNLIDSSLLKSLRKILEHRAVFGPQILSYAINIMATFVHNEPTSLTTIQEHKLPEAFYAAVEDDIEANFEVMASIPNAVGALCLNQAGLDMFNSRRVIPKLFSLFTSARHNKVLQDRDNASIFGSSIDELIRHQPSTKQMVMDSIMECLNTIEREGRSFQLPEAPAARSCYSLLAVPPPVPATDEVPVPVPSSAPTGGGLSQPNAAGGVQTIAMADVMNEEPEVIRKDEANKETNSIVASIDVTARFLEGLFQTTSHCKDFLKSDGLHRLLGFYSLPCLPYDFSASMTADSLVTLIRYMTEISPSSVLMALLKDVKVALDETGSIWESKDGKAQLVPLLEPRAEGDELERANATFRKLVSLNSRTHLLSDICQTFTYAGHKMPSTFLQTLNASVAGGTVSIAELGRLLRAAAWESMLLKAVVPPPRSADTKKAGKQQEGRAQDSSSESALAQESGVPDSLLGPAPSGATPLATPGQADAGALAPSAEGRVDVGSGAVASAAVADPEDPKTRNAIALRYIASQIPVSLSSFFKETVHLLVPRRTQDSAHKKAAQQCSTEIAQILLNNLELPQSQNMSNNYAFTTIMIGQIHQMLFDERSSAQSVHTLVLVAFEKAEGLQALFELYRKFTNELDQNFDVTRNLLSPQDPVAAIRIGHACHGLKTAMTLFQKLTSAKGLVDSAQSTYLIKESTPSDSFEPHDYVVKLRSLVLPVARETWEKPWLCKLPVAVNRLVIQTILAILRAQSETAPAPKKTTGTHMTLGSGLPAALAGLSASAFGAIRRPPPSSVVDENHIRQLTDMGFPRNAARHALSRSQGNLSAATEYLLMHPEVVSQMAAEPENEPGSDVASNAPASEAQEANGATSSSGSAPAAEPEENPFSSSVPEANAAAQSDDPVGNDGDAQMKDETNVSSSKDRAKEMELLRESLDKQRNEMKVDLTKRALALADSHASLVFDVKDAFLLTATESAKITQDLSSLLAEIRGCEQAALDSQNHSVSIRLRLLALILNEEEVVKKLEDSAAKDMMTVLQMLAELVRSKSALAKGQEQQADSTMEDASIAVPSWLASQLLVFGELLALDENTIETKIENVQNGNESDSSATSDVKHTTSLPSARRVPLFDQSVVDAVFDFAMHVLDLAEKLSRDDMLALYRLISVSSRRHWVATNLVRRGGIQALFRPFHTSDPKSIAGCQTFVVMILRHIVEDIGTLSATIDQEIQGWFAQARNKATDTNSLLRQLDYAALRDPDAFLQVARSKLEMTEYSSTKGAGYVKIPEKPADQAAKDSSELANNGQQSLASLRLGDEPMDVPASPTKEAGNANPLTESKVEDQFSRSLTQFSHAPSEELDAVMQFLLSEMLKHGKDGSASGVKKSSTATTTPAPASGALPKPAISPQTAAVVGDQAISEANQGGATNEASGDESKVASEEEDSTYFYTCFIMQCLTELLSSYTSCKVSFINFSKKRLFGNAAAASAVGTSAGQHAREPHTPHRPRMGVLNFFLSDMVPAGFLQKYEHSELRKRMAQSNWAMSVIVALTADITLHTDVKEVAVELINVRKVVLDAVAKAIKDASVSTEPIEIRYGRLYALADLCYRLLTARPNSHAGKQTEDLTLHMAKTMLEKNFVNVLTSALADVDLNLPSVKNLLDAILKPLQHLTKVANKMGKAERKDKDGAAAAAAVVDSDEESMVSTDYSMDDDDDEDDDEIPGREETPDFYRNSSLGMHTGEMEQGFNEDDEMTDEMEEDDDVDMEEYDSEEASSESSDEEGDEDDEEVDDEHIVEVLEDMEDDEEEDAEEEGSQGSEVDEDGNDEWTDEDEEEGDFSEDEPLDFVLDDDDDGHAEGIMDAMEAMEHDAGLDGAIDDEAHDIMDEEEAEMMEDDESIDDHYDHDELSHLELADDIIGGPNQPDDRFGANWGWTRVPEARTERGGSGFGRLGASHMLPPNFFIANGNDILAAGSGHRRPRLLDLDGEILGQRRGIQTLDDVASHPLLVDVPEAGDTSASANHHRTARRAGGNAFDPQQAGYADWAQSIEDLVGGGAMQFLETLLNRGQTSDIRIELSADGSHAPRMHIDGVELGRGLPGMNNVVRRPPAASAQREARSGRGDLFAAAQAFTPMPTSTRWAEEARILHPSANLGSERCMRLKAHLINALIPSFKAHQERERKKKEEWAKAQRETAAELERKKEMAAEKQKEIEETQAEIRRLEEEQRAREVEEHQQSAATVVTEPERREAQQAQDASAPRAAPAEVPAAPAAPASEDVEMAEAEPQAGPGAAGEAESESQQTQPNLELNSLQEGIAELDRGESSVTAQPEAEAATRAESSARVMITVNGEEIDITDTGIDPTFLEALPDDMREEVLNQHLRERRAAQATSNLAQPSNIAPEFLDALPPEIRAEVIQQEALETTRRRVGDRLFQAREALSRLGGSSGGGGGEGQGAGERRGGAPADLDPADFLATLNPDLRSQVLLDQDEAFLDALPPNFMDEVNELRRHHNRHFESASSQGRPRTTLTRPRALGPDGVPLPEAPGAPAGQSSDQAVASSSAAKKPPPRDAIQLLDRSGVATLVRLLYFPQMDSKSNGLHKVLANLSENAKTRAELLNLLLMILSDGTADASAVDKSFASMSHKANKIHSTPSRPTPKRQNSLPASAHAAQQQQQQLELQGQQSMVSSVAPLSRTGEEAPFLIASRSIDMLSHLAASNQQAALFFLREDSRPPKKGKGKEKDKEVKGAAPVNVLLSLLGKQTILSNPQLVDALISLLNVVTKPLTAIAKEAGKKGGGEGGDEEKAAVTGTSGPVASEETGLGQEAASTSEQQATAGPSATAVPAAVGAAQPAAVAEATESKAVLETTLSVAPHIPNDKLAAVVKPLATAISSKGFQHTLSVASHLSSIEGARDIISDALRQQAETASKTLVGELDKLLETLPLPTIGDDEELEGNGGEPKVSRGQASSLALGSAAESGVSTPLTSTNAAAPGGSGRIQSAALTSLASPSSAQAVFLRSLRALDYVMTGR